MAQSNSSKTSDKDRSLEPVQDSVQDQEYQPINPGVAAQALADMMRAAGEAAEQRAREEQSRLNSNP